MGCSDLHLVHAAHKDIRVRSALPHHALLAYFSTGCGEHDGEGRMTACPPWTHQHMVQAGTVGEKQRWRCRGCGYQCTRATPRGRPMWQKSLAVCSPVTASPCTPWGGWSG